MGKQLEERGEGGYTRRYTWGIIMGKQWVEERCMD
jgi:hypothetical protein